MKTNTRLAALAEQLPLVTFVLGALVLAFAYGVLTMTQKVFPYKLIQKATVAWESVQKIEGEDSPPYFIKNDPGAKTQGSIHQIKAAQSNDLILMTGGFYYRTDLCPKVGCMAWIMDRSGKVLHTWSADPEALFSKADFKLFYGKPEARNIVVQGAALDPQGNLVVTFQGRNLYPYHVGLAKFAPDGRLLWKRMDNSHHWPKVGPDGVIYAPFVTIQNVTPLIPGLSQQSDCKFKAVYQEGLRVLSPDGKVLKAFSMGELARRSDYMALVYNVRDDCDPDHVNGIDLLNAAAAAKIPGARAGDILVSVRSSSALVVLDRESGAIRRVLFGPMVAQHSPRVLPNGDFMMFDNLGGRNPEGGSRILQLDPATNVSTVLFPRPGSKDGRDFFSEAQGQVIASDDGKRILIAETLKGRVLEVDLASGEVVWTYDEISDLGPYAQRYGRSGAPRFARMQTQGAAYLTKADYRRYFGG